ncbi:MAG: hypothetical protein GXP35_18690 [Actinobacteria bacterium]|nr:hypothetical protein [Actinomycetota bacterium]
MSHPGPRTRTMVALFTAIALLAAACGSGSGDEGGVASISEGTASGGDESSSPESQSTAEAPTNPEDAFTLYDACMADAGFEFQTVDLGEGTDGAIALEPFGATEADPQAGGSGADGGEGFDEANAACEVHLSNVDSAFDLSPEQETALADADLKWRECMSDSGVDLPDPEPAGGIAVEAGDAGEAGGGDPQGPGEIGGEDFDFDAFTEAAEACESVFAEIDSFFEEGTDQ